MEPEQNTISNMPEQNQVGKSDESGNIMEQGLSAVKKPGKGLIIGMIVCAIIAVGGIGFGVWAMMDGNTQKEQLNLQISALKNQNNELTQQNADLQAQIDNQNEQRTNDKNEDQDSDAIENVSNTWPVTTSLVGNEIHFMNSDGEVVVKDNFYSFVGIKDCTTLKEEKVLRCSVETTIDKEGDNDRGVIYYGENGKIEHWSASGV